MSVQLKIIMMLVAFGISLSSNAQSDQLGRPARQYGPLKEVVLNHSEANSLEMKQGSEKSKLTKKCEDAIAGGMFDLYSLKNGGKNITVIADSSGEGQNVFPTDYYVVNQKCEPIGNRVGISASANEPRGSYHMASVLINATGDAMYFLAEEKYGPGKICMTANGTSCKRVKGYTYVRSLNKVTDRGFVPVINKQITAEKDLDVDTAIPLGLN